MLDLLYIYLKQMVLFSYDIGMMLSELYDDYVFENTSNNNAAESV